MCPVLSVPLNLAVCQIINGKPNFQASVFNSGFSNTRIRPKARVVANNRSHVPHRYGYIEICSVIKIGLIVLLKSAFY